MADHFLTLIQVLIGPPDGSSTGTEGGYENVPGDTGGETNRGITIGTARLAGYNGPMRDMTRDQAVAIYRLNYWTKPGFDKLDAVNAPLAAKLFDIGVNMGPGVGIKYLQRALNVLNDPALFHDLLVDGGLGPASLNMLRGTLLKRGREGERVLLGMVAAQQSVRYIEIAEGNPVQRKFEFGWQSNRAFNGAP